MFGDGACCDVRRDMGVCLTGVGGADDMGLCDREVVATENVVFVGARSFVSIRGGRVSSAGVGSPFVSIATTYSLEGVQNNPFCCNSARGGVGRRVVCDEVQLEDPTTAGGNSELPVPEPKHQQNAGASTTQHSILQPRPAFLHRLPVEFGAHP